MNLSGLSSGLSHTGLDSGAGFAPAPRAQAGSVSVR
jgi:hypothetical protein